MLSPEQKAKLELTQPPEDGGLWSGPKAAAWMAQKTGQAVHPQRDWDYLRLLGYSLQVPRPRHSKTAPEAFKKSPVEAVAAVEAAHPASAVEV